MIRSKLGRFLLLMPVSMVLAHCQSVNHARLLSDETTAVTDRSSYSFTYKIDKKMYHNDRATVPLDPKRKIAQITPYYSGSYSIVVMNANGQPERNDEGQPYYKDGMYAHGFIRSNGQWKPVSSKKFVDEHERDNWHDLYEKSGDLLEIVFKHGDAYANDPEVVAVKRAVDLYEVKVDYEADQNEVFFIKNYNPDSEKFHEVPTEVAMGGVEVGAGKTHTIEFDASGKKVYKIVVRWGDAKPRRSDGTWDAGFAEGQLLVNGKAVGGVRNVAFIENQMWDGLNYTGPLEIGVRFYSDIGRVHAIRVYYKE